LRYLITRMRNSIILIIAAGASAATAAAIPVNTAQDSNNVALLSTEAPNHTPQTAAAADTKSDVYEFDAEYEKKLAQVYKAHVS
jgi:acyl-CoA synthetase (AMP-forming)/AMP-acid ligase II